MELGLLGLLFQIMFDRSFGLRLLGLGLNLILGRIDELLLGRIRACWKNGGGLIGGWV